MTTTLRLGLLWHSVNSPNLGVGALTVAHAAILRAAAARAGLALRFTALGWDDPQPAYIAAEDLDARGFRLRDFARARGGFADAVGACDAVFDIGAGDSFADIYGASRIAKMLAAQAIVAARGAPLVLAPQTVGPFRNPALRRAALAAMRAARMVAVRDPRSLDYAREMGFADPVVLASDVALRLPFAAPPPRTGGPVRVGLNVSGLLAHGGYDGRNAFGLKADYGALMETLAADFLARPGVELHLVGHVGGDDPRENDARAADRLAAAVPGTVTAPTFATPSAAKSYIAGLDFFVGARMHACVAAFSAGVPVTPLAYSRKFEGLFGALGYDATIDLREADAETVRARVAAAFDDRAALAARARSALAEGLRRLEIYEDAVAGFLTDLAAAPGRRRGRSAS